ncbi:MAG: transcription elongation factor GreA [Lachnospiraceae bacterium]|nr:transcription elongation factor GreA [Lachnospiraceae bacterium]
MEEKKNILTYESLKKYEDELHNLKVVRRREVAQKIKEAREQGDLSENAEYDAAMDEQRDIEARIEKLENILKNAEIVDEDEISTDVVSIGCLVKIRDMETKEEEEYKIGGSTEANPLKNIISNESPVGAALIGKKAKETVTVETPAGPLKYKILSISKATEVK